MTLRILAAVAVLLGPRRLRRGQRNRHGVDQ